jgi:hypothetical protein
MNNRHQFGEHVRAAILARVLMFAAMARARLQPGRRM